MTKKELIKKWKGNQRYTLKFVDAMPMEHFDAKPSPKMKSYQSQLSHITTWLRTHSKFVTGEEFPKVKMTSKALVQEAIEDFFETFLHKLQAMDEADLSKIEDVWYGKTTRYQITNIMDNHLSHHRGQMVVYLRLQGIKPPSYLGW